jgi:hypothetical protein
MPDVRKVLDEIERRAIFHKPGVTAEDSRDDVPKLVAALRAVLDLHRLEMDGNQPVCVADFCCAPCPTVRAITEALGGTDD